MAQHDYVIANASGATVRADINNMALAISSNNSGSSAPSTTYAYLWWIDTSNNLLKLRNSANNAWITMPFSVTANNTVDINGGTIDGTAIGASAASTGAFTTLTATTFTSTGIDDNADATAITINSSEQVGIGTTSPNQKLDVYSTDTVSDIRVTAGSNAGIEFYSLSSDSSARNWRIGNASNSHGSLEIMQSNAKDGSPVGSGGTYRLVIDSSGKVGIGTTSPASVLALHDSADMAHLVQTNTANSQKLEIGNAFSLYSGASGAVSAVASDSVLAFATADTERMRIASSGNVGIGTTSPTHRLLVKSDANSNPAIVVQQTSNTDGWGIIPDSTNGNLEFTRIGGGTTGSHLTITNAARVGIGTTSPAKPLSVHGNVEFRTSNTDGNEERINWNVGGASDAPSQTMYGADGATPHVLLHAGGNSYFTGGNLGVGDNSPAYRLELPNTANANGQIRCHAVITYSDERIKSNIQTLDYGLDVVKQLKPSKYKHHNSIKEDGQFVKQDEGADDIGFIAQEVLPLIPEVVSIPVDKDKDLYSISYPKLTAVLTKAIQEQQTIIDDLKARIETLEGE